MEWDCLIPQANLTINLLCNSRVNPALSAHTYTFGNFDFNKTPLAPPGSKVTVHQKATHWRSWSYHGTEGWSTGSSTEHYCCIKRFMPETAAEVDADT
eukprot:847495-Ditylum_brightwellii.AAC.1